MEFSKCNYMLSQAMINVKGLETTENLGEENQNLRTLTAQGLSWVTLQGSATLVCVYQREAAFS